MSAASPLLRQAARRNDQHWHRARWVMSCGQPHATPCTEVLDKLSEFIDAELDTASIDDIRAHLDECGPCLAQEELERWLKSTVARCCASEPAPEQVRVNVVRRLEVMRAQFTTGEVTAQSVRYTEMRLMSAPDSRGSEIEGPF